jgi:NAD(P)-dependent dehydrogenase (short-subunit alcohol dehydrogenase family)
MGRTADVELLVRSTLARFRRLDVLFNNAGVSVSGSATEIAEEDWDRVLNINLKGVWRGMKYAIPEMLKRGGGSIINCGSVQALVGFPGWAGYAASKGGVLALTQQAAVEYARYNVRVNAIAPGTIMSPMNERIFASAHDPAQLMMSWSQMHAMGRIGRPEEVAQAVVFLASDESSFITGECLRVDGGLVINAQAGQAP